MLTVMNKGTVNGITFLKIILPPMDKTFMHKKNHKNLYILVCYSLAKDQIVSIYLFL